MGERYEVRAIARNVYTEMAVQWSVGVAGEKPVSTPTSLREAMRTADELNRLHAEKVSAEAALAAARADVARLRTILSPLAEIAKLVQAERERITRENLVAEGFTVDGALAEWIERDVFGAAYQLFGEEEELLAWFRAALAATGEGGETP